MENSTSPTDPGMEWAAQMDAQDGGPTTRRWVAVVRVAVEGESYRLAGDWAGVASANRFLRPLEARAFARATVRAYAYDLLNVARVAVARRLTLADGVPTDVFDWLDGQRPPRSPAGTVVALRSRTGAAAASMNRRVAALRACFEHEVLAGVRVANPVPAPRRGAGLRPKARGPLGHLGPGRTRGGGRLVRQPRRWPESLDPDEVGAFVADRRRDRDRALGLGMRLGGLRAGEVLGLRLAEVDPGRGRVRVVGKGGRERTCPSTGRASRRWPRPWGRSAHPGWPPRRASWACTDPRPGSGSPRRGCAAGSERIGPAPVPSASAPTACGTPRGPNSPRRGSTGSSCAT